MKNEKHYFFALFILLSCVNWNVLYSQANACGFTAELSDSCATAPLFCQNYLDSLCTNNFNGTADTFGLDSLNCSIENNVWMRIPVCDSTAMMSFYVDSCANSEGLEISLWQITNCESFFAYKKNCDAVLVGNNDTLTFEGLTPFEIYYVMIDGINGDECSVQIQGVSGIFTNPIDSMAPLPGDTLDQILTMVVPASIEAPEYLCVGEPIDFTFIPPVCMLQEGSCEAPERPEGGASRSDSLWTYPTLCSESIQFDTIVYWEFPNGVSFIGDSTSLTVSVEIGLEFLEDIFGDTIPPVSTIDTLSFSYSAYWEIVEIEDSLDYEIPVYCDCPGEYEICGECSSFAGGSGGVIYEVNYEYYEVCAFDCVSTDCGEICGAGIVECVSPCLWNIIETIEIQEDFIFEEYTISDPGECVSTAMGELCGPGVFSDFLPDLGICGTWIQVEITLCETEFVGTVNICPNDCYTNALGDVYCDEGTYIWTVPGPQCDTEYTVSIVFFSTPPIDFGTIALCEGECFTQDGFTFCDEGSHQFTTMDDNGCETAALVNLIVNPTDDLILGPATEVCNIQEQTIDVSFSVDGDGPFLVNGSPWSGGVYTVSGLPSPAAYSFTVETTGACPSSETYDGFWECPLCQPDAGDLNKNAQYHCPDGIFTIEENIPPTLEVGMVMQYWIHEGAIPTDPGFVDFNASGVWNFNASLFELGKTYYSSRVVGYGTEGVPLDLSESCNSFVEGPAITFYSYPGLNMPFDEIELNCLNENVLVEPMTQGGSGNYIYEWYLDGMMVGSGSNYDLNDGGNLELKLIDGLTGCDIDDALMATSNKLEPNFDLGDAISLGCELNSAMIVAESMTSLDVVWSGEGPNGESIDLDPLQGIEVATVGWYYFTALDENNHCETTDSVEVQEANNPSAFELVLEEKECLEATIGASLLVEDVVGGTAPFALTLNGDPINIMELKEDMEAGQYVLEVMDDEGCSYQEGIAIMEPETLTSDLTATMELVWGEEITLDPTFNFDAANVSWILEDGTSVAGSVLNHQVEGATQIELVAESEEGCSFSQLIQLRLQEVDEPVFIPNAFSPNGDNNNEYFEIFTSPFVEKIETFNVFDRWGEVVFVENDFLPGSEAGRWDGRLNGKNLQTNVFMYYAEVLLRDGTTRQFKGDVLMIR